MRACVAAEDSAGMASAGGCNSLQCFSRFIDSMKRKRISHDAKKRLLIYYIMFRDKII